MSSIDRERPKADVPDVKDRGAKKPKPLEPTEKPRVPKPKMGVIRMEKVKKFLTNVLRGENLIGQIYMVALDLLPGGGALSELMKAAAKKAEESGVREALNERVVRMKWLQFVLTVVSFIAGLYAYISGAITLDELFAIFGG